MPERPADRDPASAVGALPASPPDPLDAFARAVDWSRSPLGPPSAWPRSLRTTVSVMLSARQPMCLAWGKSLGFLYNDAYALFLGPRHPAAQGRPIREVWPDVWADIEPLIERTLAGESLWLENLPLTMTRHGYPEATWWTFSYSPLRDDEGRIAGFIDIVTDTTPTVLAERRLTRERDRQRDLLQRMPGFVAVTRGPDHVFEYVNDAFVAIAGVRDYLGRGVRDVFPELIDQGFFALLDQVYASGEAFAANARSLRLAGQRYIDFIYQPVRDDTGTVTGIFIGGYDVTERVRVERELRASDSELRETSARYGAALALARLGSFEWDVRTGAILLDARARQIFGMTADEGRTAGELLSRIASEDRLRVRRSIRGARQRGERLTIDFRVVLPDGRTRDVACQSEPLADRAGTTTSLVGVFEDTTERRRAETERARSAAELQRLNETLEGRVAARTIERDRTWRLAQDLLVVARRDGTLLAVNAAWTRLLGWTEAQLVGRDFRELAHPDDLATGVRAFVGMFAAPLTEPLRIRLRHRDGDHRWFAFTGADEEGRVYASGRDVTAEIEKAQALAQTEEQLRQAQKMEAVGQLTGGIAHDFNNLLTGVIGSLDMMQRRLAKGDTDRLDRYMQAAITSAHRAAALTHRLLAFSRRQPLDPKAVSVNRLVTGMEELLRRTIGESIGLQIISGAGVWQTLCDPHQLESAILNLAINARDAMPNGGRLTIQTSNQWLDAARLETRRGATAPDARRRYVCVAVTDTGVGMDKATMARAFEPFFTTKPTGQGTGLGLSMIYGFAQQSEGFARIESTPGLGTTVRIYLPRHGGAGGAGGAGGEVDDVAVTPVDPPVAEQGEVVLVVEDETAVRELVVDVLSELGYRAIEAVDGLAGLAVLESSQRIDLLVSDVGLPGLNGRQLADRGRDGRPGLKVLFMTGYAENATLAQGFLAPGMAMITKPFAIEALAVKIREMIEGRVDD